ncbi:ABC transporter permease subunit [Nocardioides iriomotensis]|nr:ABC transporter permease subunit [Nocardioides iriomotensis]
MLLDTLLAAAAHVSGRLLPGLALGVAVGAALAVLAARTRPGLTWLAVVPEIVLVTAWFAPGVALAAVCAGVPVLVLTSTALRHPDVALAEAMGTLPLSRRQVLRHVVLPAALPRLFLGVRIGAAAAVLGLLAVETFGAADALVLATVALLGALTLVLVRGLEKRVLAWR